MGVIFDANIFVSMALRSKKLQRLRDAWEDKQFTVLLSTYLLSEVQDVLSRPKLARYLDEESRESFMQLIKDLSEAVTVKQPHPKFRDPKDRYLLAMLRDTDAEMLITGDSALLELGMFEEKLIINPTEFLELLKD
jgi:uncharacterized protein